MGRALGLVLAVLASQPAWGGEARAAQAAPCRLSAVRGVIWHGAQTVLPLSRLAAYAAPVYWFSPDEPGLRAEEGGELQLPIALPFEPPGTTPVVYYQFGELTLREGAHLQRNADPAQTQVDLRDVVSFRLHFYAYFPTEQGVGAHEHDVEGAEFKAVVLSTQGDAFHELTGMRCSTPEWVVAITRVSAKAHGLFWFWNISDTTDETRLPMHLLVEEGKHALATDKNSDGYYTPGYDVSQHLNDAWGVRDATRSGLLFSGGYQAWMSKVRRPEDRLFPPLPEDSPLRAALARRVGDAPMPRYALRPLPPAERARSVRGLYPFLKDKDVPDWPVVQEASSLDEVAEWLEEGQSLRSLSLSLYSDGALGASLVVPLLLVRNVEAPIAGGYLVHRVYLKDHAFRDFGWMLMYTPSASRWFDTYFAAGVERDREELDGQRTSRTSFVLETGVKLRVNLSRSPLRFLSVLTPFWGVRFGLKNYGFQDIDRLTYVLEVGAGVW
ncbi:hypothetical protein FGE12_13135 [Aggregicoccus sp. 17bor-14]|uniref:hypothetical protein n=1 Tax=Myxococcaceae TaxID=31 RepID=UPI00129D1C6D|nr:MULTISPECIES: hypothetical protein [Myxococcaceae]MBF5043335.1 hypothetical protein [Simulacricoccus sp. 17bor-14]MRI89094.1 hypothetical protein [Aggregicoccus sp. 17bor-14]